MVTIQSKESKFNRLFNYMHAFPFIRIALFAAIAGIVFRLFSLTVISRLFFFVIPLAVAGRIFSLIGKALMTWFEKKRHPVTKFVAICLFITIECIIVGMAFSFLGTTEGVIGSVSSAIASIVFLLVTLALFFAAMGLLVRLFIAFFIPTSHK